MKVRFPLEPLLVHRRHIEQRARVEFEAERQNRDKTARNLNRLLAELNRVALGAFNLPCHPEPVEGRQGEIGSVFRLAEIDRAVTQQRAILAALEIELERKRESYIEARRERKILEKLKERRTSKDDTGSFP